MEPKEGIREGLIQTMQEMTTIKRKIKKVRLLFKAKLKSITKLEDLKAMLVKKLQGIGDQDVIEKYFEWKNNPSLHLDEKYNVFAKYSDYYAKKSSKSNLSCIHFIGRKKPWNLLPKEIAKLKNKLSTKKSIQYNFLDDYTK